mmetsp:Transcript_4397/g.13315  ORF Transcript_4397/g.13315 Transcript_4397/m.13315 type:complete len:241 (+) Transcript_4397:636-1358(+)
MCRPNAAPEAIRLQRNLQLASGVMCVPIKWTLQPLSRNLRACVSTCSLSCSVFSSMILRPSSKARSTTWSISRMDSRWRYCACSRCLPGPCRRLFSRTRCESSSDPHAARYSFTRSADASSSGMSRVRRYRLITESLPEPGTPTTRKMCCCWGGSSSPSLGLGVTIRARGPRPVDGLPRAEVRLDRSIWSMIRVCNACRSAWNEQREHVYSAPPTPSSTCGCSQQSTIESLDIGEDQSPR